MKLRLDEILYIKRYSPINAKNNAFVVHLLLDYNFF